MIYEERGSVYVEKSALTTESIPHVQSLFNKYDLLVQIYSKENIIAPTQVGDKVKFELIVGKSFHEEITSVVMERNIPEFLRKVSWYVKFVDGLSRGEYCEFYNTTEFIDIFGKRQELEGLKSFTVSNLDLIFDNIINSGDSYKIIDYEWVFNFPIPVEFIIYRAVFVFYYNNYLSLQHFIKLQDIITYLGISESRAKLYEDMMLQFSKYVGTFQEDNKMNRYLKSQKVLKNTEVDEMLYLQLFISTDKLSFCEENSVKIDISGNQMEFEIDVSEYSYINSFRIDPLNKNAVVKLKSLQLIDIDDNEEDIRLDVITSNAKLNIDDMFVFEADDPQMYFYGKQHRYKTVKISIEWMDNSPLTIQQNHVIIEQKSVIAKQNHVIIEQKNVITQQEDEIVSLNNVVVKINEDLIAQHEILKQEQVNNNYLQTIVQDQEELLDKLRADNEVISQLVQEKDQEIQKIHQTRVWRIYVWLRKTFKT